MTLLVPYRRAPITLEKFYAASELLRRGSEQSLHLRSSLGHPCHRETLEHFPVHRFLKLHRAKFCKRKDSQKVRSP